MKPGVVMWFTGLPASGKSTLARRVQRELGDGCVLLDGDEVRAALFPRLGYGPRARAQFYRALARLAALLARQGRVVLVPATASARAHRRYARQLAPRFVEVFVDTPLAVCARRDPKGLYRSGVALPGRGQPYQPPEAPELHLTRGATPAAVRSCVAHASRSEGRAAGRGVARRAR